jgi:hypothetical protein
LLPFLLSVFMIFSLSFSLYDFVCLVLFVQPSSRVTRWVC